MKRRICKAVVISLDRHGYAGTSINQIQAIAQVSRGALTHHFPTKKELIIETIGRLLSRSYRPLDVSNDPIVVAGGNPAEAYLVAIWERIVDTKEGRALIEILVAIRTDPELSESLADDLVRWNDLTNAAWSNRFSIRSGNQDDALVIWNVCRTFIRGLLLQERFASDSEELRHNMRTFAKLISPMIHLNEDNADQSPADD